MVKTEIYITKHAYKRAKERLGWSTSVVNKMLPRIYKQGIHLHQTKGTLRKYCLEKAKGGAYIRIYGQHLYLFQKQRLVTLYRIESPLIKHLKLYT